MGKSIVRVSDLSYRYPYGDTDALSHVSFEIEEGEFLAVLGPTGSGKSTLCYTMNGVVPQLLGGQMEGSVEVLGMDTKDYDISELAQGVGLVLQTPRFQLFNVTVESEIAFGPENLGVPPEIIENRVQEALQTVGLLGLDSRKPTQLSGGQKQRLAIASVLAMKPKLLVLDEPTSEIDPSGSEQVYEVLWKLNRENGMTILLVSHKSEFVAEFAHRILVLKNGQLLAQGTPKDVFSNENLMREALIVAPQVSELAFNLSHRGIRLPEVPIKLEGARDVYSEILRESQETKKVTA
jgi:energy-coupling factor transporter ATP-binding protein EcfA2